MAVITSVKWVLGYLRAHPVKSLFVLITAIFEPVLYMIPLFISADIVGILVAGGGWNEVWVQFKILIPLTLIQVTIFFLSSFLNEILAHRVTTDMTYDLFEVLQNRSLTYHDGKDVGEIMARATNDTRGVNMGLSPGIRMILALFSIWVVALILLNTINLIFMIIGFVVFILFLILTGIYGKRIEPVSTKVLEELSTLSSITTDTLSGVRDLKTYVAEPIFSLKFKKQAIKQAKLREREGILGSWFYPDLIVIVFIFSTIAIALYLTLVGQLSIRDLVLIATVLTLVGGMSNQMQWVSFVLVGAYAAIKRLNQFMQEEDPYDFDDGIVPFENIPASIEFDNVYFSYPNQITPALKEISFKIEESQTLAIVGSPGSGKSTLTKLIQRLYLPQIGEISIGGSPIGQFTNHSLRQSIATVEQEVYLFNDSIFENIRFGKPKASEDEVMQVAIIAQAHDFISNFPNNYDTIIGEDGVRLSGGQAQRIAIARALLINPEILIFDDGASALDAETEAEIQEAISEILQTRTTIITTHRLAIIAKAHKILILDEGRMVGFGSHEELIKTNHYYRQLFAKHFELPPMISEDFKK